MNWFLFKLRYKLQNLFHKLKKLIMPLFSRSSSFRTPRKPPKRNKSVNSIPLLDDTLNFTSESIGLDSSNPGAGVCGSLTMKLGDIVLAFNQGNWSVVSGKEGDSKGHMENSKLQEENNLLRFKVELLLDMLAASNADCLQLQRELEATKKRTNKRK